MLLVIIICCELYFFCSASNIHFGVTSRKYSHNQNLVYLIILGKYQILLWLGLLFLPYRYRSKIFTRRKVSAANFSGKLTPGGKVYSDKSYRSLRSFYATTVIITLSRC